MLAVQININTGVESINVNGTKYTSSQKIYVEQGTNVTWTATAKNGYGMNKVSGTINNIQETATISPTASKLTIIDPSIEPTVSNICPHYSPTRKTCYFSSIIESAKYICNSNCGAVNLTGKT